MATTTNYSWSTPDDTALVKDGAAAIRSLGTAIDTTVFTNAGAAIAKATVDAKGDLIAGTADNTVARLAVGANDTVLTADSSAATGLKWATPAAGGMTLLSTTTLSGASTTVGSISQSYNNLYCVVKLMTNASAAYNLDIACNGATSATTYTGFEKNSTGNGTFYTGTSQNVELEPTFANGYSQTDSNNILVMDIFNYAATDSFKIINLTNHFINSAGNQSTSFYIAGFRQNTAITSIDFKCNGTFNGGTVLLYGVK